MHIAAVVLAAGHSTRMGGQNKLLLPLGPQIILQQVVERIRQAGPDDLIVVTGYDDRHVRESLNLEGIRIAYNPEHETGMASSIRRGIIAAGLETDGYLICLGDMPYVRTDTMIRLKEAAAEHPDAGFTIPACNGRRGNPVIIRSEFRPHLLQLQGDEGARNLFSEYPDRVLLVETNDEGILLDIDTPGAYQQSN